MSRSNLERYAPFTGIVFVILIVVAAIIGGETPDVDDSLQSVVDFWQDNDTSQIWANVIGAWSALFLVWFAGTLRSTLRRTEGDTGRLSAISFGGALLAAAGLTAFAGFGFAAADIADDVSKTGVAPQVLQTLSVLSSDFFLMIAAGVGLFMIANGISVVRYGALPTWMGWVGLIIGIAAVTPAGFFALLAMLVWVLIASVLLYQRSPAPPAAPATPASPGAP